MEALVNQVVRCSSKERADVGEKLTAFLQQPDADVREEAGTLVNALLPWLSQSNYKVALTALNALHLLAERLGEELRPYVTELAKALLERLGDTKEQIRGKAMEVIFSLMDPVSSPRSVWEVIGDAGFKHKNWHARQMVLECFQQTLARFGTEGMTVSRNVPVICKLVSDPNEHVREAAICALVEAYRNVGERVRHDVEKQSSIPASKLPSITERFDAMLHSGTMVARSLSRQSSDSSVHSAKSSGPRSESAGGSRKSYGQSSTRSRSADSASHKRASAKTSSSGGVTEEEFEAAMYEGNAVTVQSESELAYEFKQMGSVLIDDKEDWEKRVVLLKRLRGMVLGGADDLGNFFQQLRGLTDALVKCVTDLRSGVTREACITVAQLADAGKTCFEPFVEIFVPPLFRQVMINTKVMADSADLCLRHIVRSTYSNKTLTLLSEQRRSKSATQRRKATEYLLYALECWDTPLLQRHLSLITKFLTEAQSDADSAARATARRAFWRMHAKFPAQADKLMDSLDPSRQKHLRDERSKMEAGQDLDATLTTVVSSSRSGSARRRRSASNPHSDKARPKSQDNSLTIPTSMQRSKSDLDAEQVFGKKTSSAYGSGEEKRSPRGFASTPRSSNLRMSSSGPMRVMDQPVAAAAASDVGKPKRVRPALGPSRREETKPLPSASSSSSAVSGARRVTRPATSPNLPRATTGPARRVAPRSPPPSSAPAGREDETPLRAAYGDDLTELLRLSHEPGWSDRMQAASRLKELLRSSRRPTPKEIKKMTDYFIENFAEPHNKVFANVVDTLCDFIVVHKGACPESWLWDLLTALLLKLGSSDLVSKTHAKILYTLELVRDSFPVHAQLSALFKLLLDTRQQQNIKVRIAILEYIALLVPRATSSDFETVYNASPTEGRGATQRIIEMSQEPKSSELRKMATHVVTELFELDPPLFSRILSALSILPADIARRILSTHIENWEEMIDGGVSFRGDEDLEAEGYPSVAVGDEDEPAADDSEAPAEATNGYAAAPRSYNPSVYEDQQQQPSQVAPAVSEEAALEDVLGALSEVGSDTGDTEATLKWLIRKSKENDADTWEQQFSSIFGVVLGLLDDQMPHIRDLALRMLRELLKNQVRPCN